MRTQLFKNSSDTVESVLEKMIQKGNAEIIELVRKNAKQFGVRNLPSAKGDNLSNYTGNSKTKCEKLAIEIIHFLQPDSQFPEASVDAEYFKEKVKNIDLAIKEKEDQNRNDEHDLDDFHKSYIPSRIKWALILSLIVGIGEILFNTKSFQVIGDNLLFALILSISISICVFMFSHVTPFLYKDAKNRMQRISVIAGSLFLATVLFTALAIFRSSYLASHDITISPVYFVIINLFFFIVSALMSFFVLPTWKEIKQNSILLKIYYAVKNRKKEKEILKNEREQIKTTILERTKSRIRIAHHANYALERIRKMYSESIAVFKTINLTYRTDGNIPDCFSEEPEELNIGSFNFTIINTDTSKQ